MSWRNPRRLLSRRLGLLAGVALALAFAASGADAQSRGGFGRGGNSIGIGRPQGPVGGNTGGMPQGPRGGGFGRGGFGIGIGFGDMILNRPPPVYDVIDEPPPRPRRPRRPVIVEEYDDEPVVRRPPRRKIARQAPPPPPPAQARRTAAPRLPPVVVPPSAEQRLVADEVLLELRDASQLAAVAARHGLTLISSERFAIANATIARFRVGGGRSARAALAQMAGDARIASAQPNYVYTLQQEARREGGEAARKDDAPPAAEIGAVRPAAPAEPLETQAIVAPDVAPPELPQAPLAADALPRREPKPQYVLARMGIDQAQRLATGAKVRVAVIDSGPDPRHPELEKAIATRFDALEGEGEPHGHGTAIAGAIAARFSLEGVAPAAEILAARAFSAKADGSGAQGTTWHVLRSLDWAATEQARVVNMSFAGPQDQLLTRALAGLNARGVVAVAAAGNGGPTAPAAFPGGDATVIAVTATDAEDKAFGQANRGAYIAVAAPGVDVLAAAPQGRYEFSTGTSIAAAHVSGLVALMLERQPNLNPARIRAILAETALDLGPKGRDSVFGAGRVDAPAALARAAGQAAAQR